MFSIVNNIFNNIVNKGVLDWQPRPGLQCSTSFGRHKQTVPGEKGMKDISHASCTCSSYITWVWFCDLWQVVKLLLDQGSDPKAKTSVGLTPLRWIYSLYIEIGFRKSFCMSFSGMISQLNTTIPFNLGFFQKIIPGMIFQLRCYSWRPGECHNDHELCKQVQNTPDNVFFVVMFTQPGKMQYFGEIKITNSLSENGDLNMLTWWFSGSKLMPQITTTQLLFTTQPSIISALDFLDKNKRIKLQ